MSTAVTEVTQQTNTWDVFLEYSRPDIGFKQSAWWADFLATRGWGHFGVALRESGEIIAGSNILKQSFGFGRSFYYIPHGPVLPDDDTDAEEAFAAIMAYIEDERNADSDIVSHLRIEPLWEQRPDFIRGCREAGSWMDPRDTLCVDLSLSEDEILAQMKQKGRYNIRVARRKGVTIVEDASAQGLTDFEDIFNDTRRRHTMRGHSTTYFKNLMERLIARDDGTIFFAEHEGTRIATALIIYFGGTASYKYGGSLHSYRSLMAPYLLHFEVMMTAKARGHRWYDFCGIAPADKPNDRWAGFSAFKRKFGGCERSYVPAMDFVYDRDAYEEYRRRK